MLAGAKFGEVKGKSNVGLLFESNVDRVYQMLILEQTSPNATRTPQGVVLALVSTETPESVAKGEEPPRSLRMYNLASLVSLVRWATAQTVSDIVCQRLLR